MPGDASSGRALQRSGRAASSTRSARDEYARAVRERDRAQARRSSATTARIAPSSQATCWSGGGVGAETGRPAPSILVIDNYDSFTWNLVHYLRELGAEVRVERNDALSAAEALASGADAFLISPGPGTPDEAGISLDLVAACAEARRPLLGVCLGHQAIGRHFGGKVVRAPRRDARQDLPDRP